MFATNCWILATKKGSECVIVDPGMPDVSFEVSSIVENNNLKPVAVLATHGHLDHTYSIKPICDGYGIPTLIHPDDRPFLAAPEKLHGVEFTANFITEKFFESKEIREVKSGEILDLVGMKFEVIHAPGHTRGSIMFKVDDEILISGDVLFKGSIGRTDLPTGSSTDMTDSLLKKVLPLADSLRVLPGHGPETTIGDERKYNSFLKQIIAGGY